MVLRARCLASYVAVALVLDARPGGCCKIGMNGDLDVVR